MPDHTLRPCRVLVVEDAVAIVEAGAAVARFEHVVRCETPIKQQH